MEVGEANFLLAARMGTMPYGNNEPYEEANNREVSAQQLMHSGAQSTGVGGLVVGGATDLLGTLVFANGLSSVGVPVLGVALGINIVSVSTFACGHAARPNTDETSASSALEQKKFCCGMSKSEFNQIVQYTCVYSTAAASIIEGVATILPTVVPSQANLARQLLLVAGASSGVALLGGVVEIALSPKPKNRGEYFCVALQSAGFICYSVAGIVDPLATRSLDLTHGASKNDESSSNNAATWAIWGANALGAVGLLLYSIGTIGKRWCVTPQNTDGTSASGSAELTGGDSSNNGAITSNLATVVVDIPSTSSIDEQSSSEPTDDGGDNSYWLRFTTETFYYLANVSTYIY